MSLTPKGDMFPCLDGVRRVSEPVNAAYLSSFDIQVPALVSHGHGIASKQSGQYPDGTIRLQYPHFLKRGLDLGQCFPGTLNLSIAPRTYEIVSPTYRLEDVDWYPPRGKTENFLLCECVVDAPHGAFKGLVYLPDPSTKLEHFDNPSHLQILAPFIPGLVDDQQIPVLLKSTQVRIID